MLKKLLVFGKEYERNTFQNLTFIYFYYLPLLEDGFIIEQQSSTFYNACSHLAKTSVEFIRKNSVFLFYYCYRQLCSQLKLFS